jgi:DNA-binding response OmpR family regulator
MNMILVVDDDSHVRELVRIFLQREGFAVVEAIDGVEALEQLATRKADLVILDLMMPQMDGWELCRQLRMVYDIPILMLTAKGEPVTLPLKEFEVLFKLAGSPDRTFSRDQLIEDIWGYDFDGNERTLDVHINRLRDRFPEERHSFRIRTIRGLGYRLEARS